MTQSLTEGTVLNRTRASCLQDVTQLNCWGCNLKDCKLLERMPNLKVLSVSSNALQSLRDFACCRNLHELYVRNNDIRHLEEIYWLKDLPHLHTLWLDGNPCVTSLSTSPVDKQHYRDIVLKHLPQLKVLDQTSFIENDHKRVQQIERQLSDFSTSSVILKALSLKESDSNAVKSSSSSSSSIPGSCRSVPEQQKVKNADQFFIDLNERLQQVTEGSQVGSSSASKASANGLGRRAASARQSARSTRGEKFFLDISARDNKIVKDSPSTPASDQTYTARESSANDVEIPPDDRFSRDYERLKREYKERQLQQYQLEHTNHEQDLCRPSSPSMVRLNAGKIPSPSRESNSTTIADFYESEQFEDFVEPDEKFSDVGARPDAENAKPEAEYVTPSLQKQRPSLPTANGGSNKYATFTRNKLGNNSSTDAAALKVRKPIMLQADRTPAVAGPARSPNVPKAVDNSASSNFTYVDFRADDDEMTSSWPSSSRKPAASRIEKGTNITATGNAVAYRQQGKSHVALEQNRGPADLRQNSGPSAAVLPPDNKQSHRRRIYSTGLPSATVSPTLSARRPTQIVQQQQHQPFQRFQPMYQSMSAAMMGSTQSSPSRKAVGGANNSVFHQSNGNLSCSTGGGRHTPWQMTENEYRLRAANVLTAVLSLVRDLDYDSLRVVDQEVRSKIQQAASAAQQQQQLAAMEDGDGLTTPSATRPDFFGQHANNNVYRHNGHFLDESNA